MSETVTLPAEIAVFPIRGCILLPGQHLPLNVFEPRYLNMIDDAMSSDKIIGMIQPTDQGSPSLPGLERVGTAGRIVSFDETDDGRYLIVLEGLMRFTKGKELDRLRPYRVVQADYTSFELDLTPDPLTNTDLRERFLTSLKRFFELTGLEADWDSVEGSPLIAIADKVAMAAPFDPETKQALLTAQTPLGRVERLLAFMQASIDSKGAEGWT